MKRILKAILVVVLLGFNVAWIGYEHVHPVRDLYYKSNLSTYPNGMPKVLYIDGKRWQVEIVEHDEVLDAMEAYGVTMCKERVIEVHSDLLVSNYQDTLLHETMHAHICKPDGTLDNDEWSRSGGHQAIAKFAQYFPALMRANPDFAKFMLNYKEKE